LPGRIVKIPGQSIAVALAGLYLTAFVLSPYWKLPETEPKQIALLCVLIVLGAAWVLAAAGPLTFQLHPREVAALAFLVALLFVINLPMLTTGIPWRGDEDVHIERTLAFVQGMPLSSLAGLVPLLVVAAALAVWSRRLGVLAMVVFGILAIVVGWQFEIFPGKPLHWIAGGKPLDWIARYPIFNYWLFMLVPAVFQRIAGPYHEILFRLVPFLALAGTCWLFQRELGISGFSSAILWGVIAGTLPVVIYYSSILYIDPLAVVLMTIVCFRIRGLLVDDIRALRTRPEWYALVGIGFVKETAAAFLVCYILCRVVFRTRLLLASKHAASGEGQAGDRWLNRGKWLLEELAVTAATLLPCLIFIALRTGRANVRGLELQTSGVLEPSVYRAAAQSLWDQFGVFITLFFVGVFVAIKWRKMERAVFWSLAFLLVPATLVLDSGGIYAGYSRFNLLILPPVLAGAGLGLQWIARRRLPLPVLAVVLLGSNILLSPINLDGTKRPLWGSYLVDTSEHYYPYREALLWLKDQHTTGRILFADLDYEYLFEFYFRQMDWRPRYQVLRAALPRSAGDGFGMYFDCCHWQPQRVLVRAYDGTSTWDETAALERALHIASSGGFRTVVFQVMGSGIPDAPPDSDFRLSKIVHNDAHALLILSRVP
jgi:hypothetical protein